MHCRKNELGFHEPGFRNSLCLCQGDVAVTCTAGIMNLDSTSLDSETHSVYAKEMSLSHALQEEWVRIPSSLDSETHSVYAKEMSLSQALQEE